MDEKYADENGEIYRPVTVLKRDNEVVKVFDPKKNGRSNKFFKGMNSREAKRQLSKLTLPETGFLFRALQYAGQYTNMLIGDGENGEKDVPLTLMQLYKIAGVTPVTGKKIYESLVKKEVLGHLAAGSVKKAIFVNPAYGMNGRAVAKEIKNAFKTESQIE